MTVTYETIEIEIVRYGKENLTIEEMFNFEFIWAVDEIKQEAYDSESLEEELKPLYRHKVKKGSIVERSGRSWLVFLYDDNGDFIPYSDYTLSYLYEMGYIEILKREEEDE